MLKIGKQMFRKEPPLVCTDYEEALEGADLFRDANKRLIIVTIALREELDFSFSSEGNEYNTHETTNMTRMFTFADRTNFFPIVAPDRTISPPTLFHRTHTIQIIGSIPGS